MDYTTPVIEHDGMLWRWANGELYRSVRNGVWEFVNRKTLDDDEEAQVNEVIQKLADDVMKLVYEMITKT